MHSFYLLSTHFPRVVWIIPEDKKWVTSQSKLNWMMVKAPCTLNEYHYIEQWSINFSSYRRSGPHISLTLALAVIDPDKIEASKQHIPFHPVREESQEYVVFDSDLAQGTNNRSPLSRRTVHRTFFFRIVASYDKQPTVETVAGVLDSRDGDPSDCVRIDSPTNSWI